MSLDGLVLRHRGRFIQPPYFFYVNTFENLLFGTQYRAKEMKTKTKDRNKMNAILT
jgi:hypothetical protein